MGRLDGLLNDWHPFFNWNNKLFRIVVFGIIFIVLLTVLIVLAVHHKGSDDTGPSTDAEDRLKFDCHPDQKETDANKIEEECKSRGCVWLDQDLGPDSLVPKCFYPKDYLNYEVISNSQYGKTLVLMLNKTKRSSGFESDVTQVKVEVTEIDDDKLRIKVEDLHRKRWEPAFPVLDVAGKTRGDNKLYQAKLVDGVLTVTRRNGNGLILKTDFRRLIFADQFIQTIHEVPSDSLYGLGETLDNHLKRVQAEDARKGRKQIKLLNYGDLPLRDKPSYGTHPFYLMHESNQKVAHGVLLVNSNAMDIMFTHTPALTYRVIGGILDFIVFMGPSPLDVIRQKGQVLGNPPLPAYWSLGYHLCRYGYADDAEINETYHANIDNGVPFDAQWADIDYMDQFNMFTYDKGNFSRLPELVNHIHETDRHFVPILDPAVSDSEPEESDAYKPYKDGLDMDVYIKNPMDKILRTRIWNIKYSVLPDFTHPNASIWWKKQLKLFHDKVQFDGLWIDMNEPAVFINGMEGGCINDSYDRPQFNPVYPMVPENVTICMSAKHHIGSHYNVHNLYSSYEAKMTYEGLVAIRAKRPFILSRATHTGQGLYTAHWLGDVDSSWDHLRMSIPLILDFNLFGIPLVGSDVCGFVQNTTVELCTRWHSVGAFYTFVRNHNDHHFIRQDPGSMGGVVLDAARHALNLRYNLLPYLYTLFFENSLYGDPVLRSLKFNFPEDRNTDDNQKQFMWSDGLMINAVMEEGTEVLEAYLPSGLWYDYQSFHKYESSGESVTMTIPLGEVNLLIRGGHIIPTTPALAHNSTATQRILPFRIIAALDRDKKASGKLYWDDGESLNTMEFQEYSLVKFDVRDDNFTSTPVVSGFKGPIPLEDVAIWGVEQEPQKVVFVDNEGVETVLQKDKREISFGDGVLTVRPVREEEKALYDLHRPFAIYWS